MYPCICHCCIQILHFSLVPYPFSADKGKCLSPQGWPGWPGEQCCWKTAQLCCTLYQGVLYQGWSVLIQSPVCRQLTLSYPHLPISLTSSACTSRVKRARCADFILMAVWGWKITLFPAMKYTFWEHISSQHLARWIVQREPRQETTIHARVYKLSPVLTYLPRVAQLSQRLGGFALLLSLWVLLISASEKMTEVMSFLPIGSPCYPRSWASCSLPLHAAPG